MFKVGQVASQHRFKALLLIVLLSLGLLFRCVNLDRKVFWVDEVATALRVAGYTRQEVTATLADGQLHTPAELLMYQRLSPDRSLADTITALQQSPEHAPLYFLLLRWWTQIWGSSVTAMRSFSVVCSLLLVATGYWLSRMLFASGSTSQTEGSEKPNWTNGIMAASLAISPVLIAYAQEARPYSLWLLTLTLSGITLLRALRSHRIADWAFYALALGASLYTSFLSGGVVIGQGLYVLTLEKFRLTQGLRRFGLAVVCGFTALLPWFWLMAQRWQTLQDNTTWMRIPIPHFAKIIIWFYSIAILYFDVPVILHPRVIAAAEIILATGVVAIVIYALYFLCRNTVPRIWMFVFSLSLPIPVMLILLDLISNGRYSTAPRYLLPFHLGSQLAIAYLIGNRLIEKEHSQYQWQGVIAFLIAVSLLSNFVHFETSPRYLKNRNLHNFPIAALINRSPQPILVSESQNTIDLLSLSHSLDQDTRIQILTPDISQQIAANLASCNFLFNPSDPLKQQIQQDETLQLKELYRPQVLIPTEFALSLWQICPR
jgi:uncharacterized membrane protein